MTCYKKHHELKKCQDNIRIQLGKYLVSGKAEFKHSVRIKYDLYHEKILKKNPQCQSNAAELPVGKYKVSHSFVLDLTFAFFCISQIMATYLLEKKQKKNRLCSCSRIETECSVICSR